MVAIRFYYAEFAQETTRVLTEPANAFPKRVMDKITTVDYWMTDAEIWWIAVVVYMANSAMLHTNVMPILVRTTLLVAIGFRPVPFWLSATIVMMGSIVLATLGTMVTAILAMTSTSAHSISPTTVVLSQRAATQMVHTTARATTVMLELASNVLMSMNVR